MRSIATRDGEMFNFNTGDLMALRQDHSRWQAAVCYGATHGLPYKEAGHKGENA